MYKVQVGILLKPVWYQDQPVIRVSAGREVYNYVLYDERWFDFEFNSPNKKETITVEFLNKVNSDYRPDLGLDKAVSIETLKFFGIQDPKFAWAGIYEPDYPEPWASEQASKGVVLKQQLTNYNYLGWNGKWTLTFDIPVFTWIHKLQNLGWIYN